jgi:hypothetical protein
MTSCGCPSAWNTNDGCDSHPSGGLPEVGHTSGQNDATKGVFLIDFSVGAAGSRTGGVVPANQFDLHAVIG